MALREKQLVMDVDDRQANLLALQDQVKRLEVTVAELQQKLAATQAVAPSTVSGKTAAVAQEARLTSSATGAVSTQPTATMPETQSSASSWLFDRWYGWLPALLVTALAVVVRVRKRVFQAGPGEFDNADRTAPEEGRFQLAEEKVAYGRAASAASAKPHPAPLEDDPDAWLYS